MTKEKLIELLEGAESAVYWNSDDRNFIEKIADHLIANGVTVRAKGEWSLLDECSNAGVYCSRCHKKVYKEHYANVRPKSNFCPNCGADMRGDSNGT